MGKKKNCTACILRMYKDKYKKDRFFVRTVTIRKGKFNKFLEKLSVNYDRINNRTLFVGPIFGENILGLKFFHDYPIEIFI